jgi:RNA polymerase sigma-70 factor (ECF subfamily)
VSINLFGTILTNRKPKIKIIPTLNMNESELLLLAKSGDVVAFTKLVKAHEIGIRSFLAARLNNYFESDDLAQETFIIAYNKLNEFDINRPFRPWLKGIAYNLLKNHWRKHRPVLVNSHEELELLIDEQINQYFSENDEPDHVNALESCMKKIDDDSKNLLTQHYVNDMSVGRLTNTYGVRHSTMTMRLHRIRSKLKDCINYTLAAI